MLLSTEPCLAAACCRDSRHMLGLLLPALLTGSPCQQTQKLLPPGKYRPVLTLLPNDGPIYIPYGTPASFHPGPCSSANASAGCGVVAWDVQASSGKRTDITPSITVSQTRDCSTTGQVRSMQLQ